MLSPDSPDTARPATRFDQMYSLGVDTFKLLEVHLDIVTATDLVTIVSGFTNSAAAVIAEARTPGLDSDSHFLNTADEVDRIARHLTEAVIRMKAAARKPIN